ncbi:MAG: integrase core domain-containing protein [Acetobacteraceae bacterium]|nr:integrase core domain-containing protein [Acetobacteraceae bacterium]
MRSQELGWLNLVAVIDVWDRCVVGHLVSPRARSAEWVAALDQAVMARFPQGIRERACGLRLQVDNGCQPTSRRFVAAARTLGIDLAYTHIQAPRQNAYIERFFRTLKEEEVWPNLYSTLDEARQSIGNYVSFYNEQRLHSALGYQPPATFARTQLLAA